MKDNFSKQAQLYARFRPTYPAEVFNFLLSFIPIRKIAWDCGTGNGQIAVELAKYFDNVFATDISENQINNAVKKRNITYKVETAEHCSFPANSFDLITVGQAIHWFSFEEFYGEAERTLKPIGVFAAIGYQLPGLDVRTDEVIKHFYENIVGAFWDDERKYIDANYRTIPFPFKEIPAPHFSASYEWTLEQFIGYVNTWSAVQHYIGVKNENPVDMIIEDLKKCWVEGSTKTVTFPILLRAGTRNNHQPLKSQ